MRSRVHILENSIIEVEWYQTGRRGGCYAVKSSCIVISIFIFHKITLSCILLYTIQPQNNNSGFCKCYHQFRSTNILIVLTLIIGHNVVKFEAKFLRKLSRKCVSRKMSSAKLRAHCSFLYRLTQEDKAKIKRVHIICNVYVIYCS